MLLTAVVLLPAVVLLVAVLLLFNTLFAALAACVALTDVTLPNALIAISFVSFIISLWFIFLQDFSCFIYILFSMKQPIPDCFIILYHDS